MYYPIFEDHFCVFKEFFSENSVLMYGYYSKVVCNQERTYSSIVSRMILELSDDDIFKKNIKIRNSFFMETLENSGFVGSEIYQSMNHL